MPAALPKLGKRAAKNDSRTLKLSKYMSLSRLPSPPDSIDYTAEVDREVGPNSWSMYANDRYGCCVIASCAHLVTTWTSMVGSPVIPTTEDVLREYSLVSGFDQATGANDNGCVLVEALNRWRQHGLFGRKILAHAQVDHDNPELIVTAAWLFGGLLLGMQMPQKWQNPTEYLGHEEWLAPTRFHRFGPWAPGSWGGHCTLFNGYGPTKYKITTWDREIPCSPHALDIYCDEIRACVSLDWLDPAKKTCPPGFDLDQLIHDLQTLQQ